MLQKTCTAGLAKYEALLGHKSSPTKMFQKQFNAIALRKISLLHGCEIKSGRGRPGFEASMYAWNWLRSWRPLTSFGMPSFTYSNAVPMKMDTSACTCTSICRRAYFFRQAKFS